MKIMTRCSICLPLLVLCIAGCGKKGRWERVLVSGDVTYQGQPIELGRIRFLPAEGSRGPVSIEKIESGSYTTHTTDGIPVGTHRVEITSFDPDEYKNAPTGPGAPPVKQLLPNKYNVESELTLSVHASPRKQTHDFTLE